MDKFKVGDSVKITKPFQDMGLVGAVAKVVAIEDGGWYGLDIEGWTNGHSCDVLEEGCVSGYWVKAGYFEKASTFKGNK